MADGKLKLWGALNSGHSYKARLFMLLAETPHQYEPVNLSLPRDQRPQAFRDIAAFGEVPVLEHGSQVLVQSNAILLHLAREFDHFGVSTESGHDAITSWLFWEANRIGRSYPNLRYCKLFDDSANKGLVEWFQSTCKADLARLDQQLDGRAFLLGALTIADIACAGYMLYGEDIGVGLAQHRNVCAWLDRIRALPRWQHPNEVMGKAA